MGIYIIPMDLANQVFVAVGVEIGCFVLAQYVKIIPLFRAVMYDPRTDV